LNRLLSFFRGLRGKLTLTYTLVTVLALLALEILLLAAALLLSSLLNDDKRSYLSDVVITLGPKASKYMQPGQVDAPGLQAWLEQTRSAGYASLEPTGLFDSPAAAIVKGSSLYALSADGTVLAQAPAGSSSLVGRKYTPPNITGAGQALQRGMEGGTDSLRLSATTPEGNLWMAVPVRQAGSDTRVIGLVIVTVRPSPPMLLQVFPTLLISVLVTGILLLMAVIPFGTLFGYIMSRGLTRRLAALTRAADAWGEGDFSAMPSDRANDEIGYLALRMRNTAERVQNLLQTQQQLAMMEERSRMARELHDTVKQQAFATLMQVRAARNLLETQPEEAGKRLEEAERLIKTSQQDLGLILAELRPAALEGQGLAGALRGYLESWSQNARIPAELNVLNERALPLEAEQALYRVAQEALSNAARHSRASAVTVRLAYEPGQVILSVCDNGVGFDPLERADGKTRGYGLQNMQERLSALHGWLAIDSTPGKGTSISATVPAE
jgi:two-component system, NarL family, sensor histidine kinase LiaS